MAVRFHLGEHAHTDIIAHAYDGFPARTGEEFLAFLRIVGDSGAGGQGPPPIAAFLESHPAARRFVEAVRRIPASFASQPYFAVTALRFTNAAGVSRVGRFRLDPEAGTRFLTAEQAAAKGPDFLSSELAERLAREAVRFRVAVQLAGPRDPVDDATAAWPADRELAAFGILTLDARKGEGAPVHRDVIFDPVPRIDGVNPAGDPLIEVRSAVYLLSGRRRRASAGRRDEGATSP